VAVWRKLRDLGAIYLQDGVAALPEDAVTREQMEWLQLRAERRRDYFRSPLRREATEALKAAREAVREREAATRAPGAESKP